MVNATARIKSWSRGKLMRVEDLQLSEEEKRKIYSENALKLLNLR